MAVHLIMESYTGQNVIAGTLLDTWTDLGVFNSAKDLDLTKIEAALAHYDVLPSTPEYRVDIAEGGIPQFLLHVVPVQIIGHHQIEV
jgi:hypothetical protein